MAEPECGEHEGCVPVKYCVHVPGEPGPEVLTFAQQAGAKATPSKLCKYGKLLTAVQTLYENVRPGDGVTDGEKAQEASLVLPVVVAVQSAEVLLLLKSAFVPPRNPTCCKTSAVAPP